MIPQCVIAFFLSHRIHYVLAGIWASATITCVLTGVGWYFVSLSVVLMVMSYRRGDELYYTKLSIAHEMGRVSSSSIRSTK